MWHPPPPPTLPFLGWRVKAAELPYLEYRDIGRQCKETAIFLRSSFFFECITSIYLCTSVHALYLQKSNHSFHRLSPFIYILSLAQKPVAKDPFSSSPQSVCSPPVFRIHRYFLQIRGSAIMIDQGSGSWRAISYGSGRMRMHLRIRILPGLFVAIEKICR
jgi:hypothetical protein